MNVLRRLAIASALSIPVVGLSIGNALAEDLVFTLKNASGSPLIEFYVEAQESSDWGSNLLTEAVEPGEEGNVTIADGKTTCTYGIKGVFADGSNLEEENLNLCELGSYTYQDK